MKMTFGLNQLTSGFLRTTLVMGLFITLLFAFANSAFAFKPTNSDKEGTHAWMVKQAIEGKCDGCQKISVDVNGKRFKFSDKATLSVERADAATDDGIFFGEDNAEHIPLGVGEGKIPKAHCDDELLPECSKRIHGFKDDAVKQLTIGKGNNARVYVGRALHTLQDFYSHSNWVNNPGPNHDTINPDLGKKEITSATLGKDTKGNIIKTCIDNWVLDNGTLTGRNPGGLTNITTGYFYYTTQPFKWKCAHGKPSVFDDSGINKDTSGRPFHNEARDLAVLATHDYINQVLDAIKNDEELKNDPEKLEEAIRAFMNTKGVNIVVGNGFSLSSYVGSNLQDDYQGLSQYFYTPINNPETLITSNFTTFQNAMTPAPPMIKLPYPAGEAWTLTSGYNDGAHIDYSSSTEQDSYGLDFALPGCQSWDKPALAVAAGTVISTDEHKDYGKTILIDHGNGFISRYAHLKSFNVSQSMSVWQGQEIARVGNSGNVTGSACPEHPGVNLHFSMYYKGKAYKPEPMEDYVNLKVGTGYIAKAKNTRRGIRDGNIDNGCSKPIMQGLYNAIAAQQTPGPIYLFTDASAKDAELANIVIATARAKNQNIYAIVTDKCTPDMKADPVLLKVTKETGGQLFQVSQSGEELTGIFDIVKSLASEEYEHLFIIQDELTDSEKNYSIQVDSSVNSLIFSVAMTGEGASHILRPTGKKIVATDNDVTVTELPNGRIIHISEPATGNWALQTTGNSTFSASVMGRTELKLSNFNFVEVRGRPLHQGEFPIHGQPMANAKSMVSADVSGLFATVEFELRSENGDFLKTLEMPSTAENMYSGELNLPTENFRIYLKGTDTNGLEFLRALPALWLGKSVKVQPVASDRELIMGQPYQVSFRVTNVGSSDIFTLLVTNNRGLPISVTPNSVTLNTDESAVVNMTLEVPNDTVTDNSVNITLLAESVTTLENNNHFSFEVMIDIDSDGDGVSDRMEQDRSGSDINFDGNGDGVPDYQQANVVSLETFDYWQYVTLETSDGEFRNVTTKQAPPISEEPKNMWFPLNLFSFSIGVNSGGSANVTMFADWPIEQYLAYGATPDDNNEHWYNLSFDGTSGTTVDTEKVILTFVDGVKGDNDLNADGVINVLAIGGANDTELTKPTYGVEGYAQDESGNPLADVLVEVNDQETTTDENGYYQINELVEGEYTVTAKAQSHNFKPQTVQVGSENPGLELNFTASKAPIDAPILYLVIDDTGSMRDNINGVQQALTEYIEILQQAILEGKISPLSVLLTFKDQDEIYSRIVTDNLNELLEQVKLLEAEGGDDCAEDSVVALNQVAAEIAEGGTILLATDAPPHEGYDELTTLIEQLRDKGITINIILTEAYCVDEEATTRRRGDGSDHFEKSIEAYSRIANEVGNGSSLSIIKRSAKKPAPEEWLQAYKDVALNIMLGTIQPTVTTVSPTHVPQGGTLDLYITAANANFNKSSFVHIDGGIKVNKIHSVSPNQIIANVTIPANTDLNRYDMRINTSLADGSIETTHGIGVIAVEAAPENPEIISIASLQNGLQLLISGINTHFEPDVTLLKFDDANITIARLTVHNETLLEARLYVTDNARLGLHDITITTGDEVVSKNQLPIFIITSPNATNATPAPMAKYCDSLGEVITISCHNQVLGDKHIGPKGYVTHGDIAGKVTSEGWVSSVTILPNAMLDGGIVTGNIDNQGTVANIDYRGGSLTGGNLAGDIIVNDEITESNLGLFRNVTLLQGANINGGIFEGIVTGKGSIKNAFFRANVKLSGVTIGEGCRFAEGVDIGTGVRFTANDLIPEETDLSAALTTYGEIDFSTDVVMDAPSLLNQINALPDMQDNNWQLEQNDGRLEVMVNGTRMRVKPKRVKQAKRNRRAAIIIHGDGTVTVITAKGREILVEVEAPE